MKSFTFPLMFLPFLISSLSAHKMKLVEITSCISLLTAAVLLYFLKSLFILMFHYGSSQVFNKYIFFSFRYLHLLLYHLYLCRFEWKHTKRNVWKLTRHDAWFNLLPAFCCSLIIIWDSCRSELFTCGRSSKLLLPISPWSVVHTADCVAFMMGGNIRLEIGSKLYVQSLTPHKKYESPRTAQLTRCRNKHKNKL